MPLVGRVSAFTGLTRKALLCYEDKGIISPARDRQGFRRYSAHDQRVLAIIVALRRGGLAIRDIREILREPSRSNRRQMAVAKLNARVAALASAHRQAVAALQAVSTHGLEAGDATLALQGDEGRGRTLVSAESQTTQQGAPA